MNTARQKIKQTIRRIGGMDGQIICLQQAVPYLHTLLPQTQVTYFLKREEPVNIFRLRCEHVPLNAHIHGIRSKGKSPVTAGSDN